MSKLQPTDNNDNLRYRWEQRALDDGSSKSSVLFRGLPENLNQYIHDFHEYILLTHYLPRIKSGASILDLGCGYGRISKIINAYNQDIHITGLDFSSHYCSLFRTQTGCNAVCADLSFSPFPRQTFDSIIAVTSLMYIPDGNRELIMANIAALLKPGGTGFFLDPGQEFSRLVNIINPSRRKQSTGGSGFTARDYDSLISSSGLKIVERGGMTFFSLAIPLILLLQRADFLLKPLLKLIWVLDKTFHSCRFLSLHQWLLVEKTIADC